ncbi:ATP-binding protein [Pokkaliibacter sp. MBI-7]|uniref:sensor histidine kinase n=1 Tax=Pokkaliibacter sp. MBI-7 TaxID=3040600 RepID=UPI00244C30A9|nr:ATP-binding protein [Pokkaliibacter sp. MBI-7]MDH2435153.1 ATP-binding protein [Pokkaliibacter sp. MBI-7]
MHEIEADLIGAMIRHSPGIFFLKNCNLEFERVSQSFLDLFGLTEAQVLGRKAEDVFAGDQRQYVEMDRKVLDTASPLFVEEHFLHPVQGRDVYLQTEKFPVYDKRHRLVGICSVSHEITERKILEQATHAIISGVSRRYNQDFFEQFVLKMREAMEASFVFVARLKPDGEHAEMIVFCGEQGLLTPITYRLEGTASGHSLDKQLQLLAEGASRLFPMDNELSSFRIEGYIGAPLIDQHNVTMGVLGAMFRKPITNPDFCSTLFRIFSDRIASELERMEAVDAQAMLNKVLEERVVARTRELEAVNQELEAFSYSVSHDLRAPLRALDGYSHALLEDYEPQLDDMGKLYLTRLRLAAQQMGSLIDSLLELSRVTRTHLSSGQVDLSEMVQGIVNDLRLSAPNRQVEVTIEPELYVDADPNLLHSVMQNLVGNAWKYSARCERASIHVGQEAINGRMAFYVKDNGIGFDATQATRLFVPFQRLHDKKDFEGTGIGLATVSRIIKRHGGKIWAESAPGQGSCFFFTLAD